MKLFLKRIVLSMFLLGQTYMGAEAQTISGSTIYRDGIYMKRLLGIEYDEEEFETVIDAQFKIDNPNYEKEALQKTLDAYLIKGESRYKEVICSDFIRLLGEGEVKPYDHGGEPRRYFFCQIDYAISQSKALENVIDFPEPREKILAKRLNLESFPNSVWPRIKAEPATLENIYGDRLQYEKGKVHMLSKRWYTGVSIHTILDINHNGKEDWIIVVHDDTINIDYFSPRLMVILDVSETGLLNVQNYDPNFDYTKMMGAK